MEKRRLQFDFSDEAVQRLDKLAVDLDASSRAEVVRRALALLDRLVEAEKSGGKVLIRDGISERELILG